MGFEPTHPKILELESSALDRSATLEDLISRKLALVLCLSLRRLGVEKFSRVVGIAPPARAPSGGSVHTWCNHRDVRASCVLSSNPVVAVIFKN